MTAAIEGEGGTVLKPRGEGDSTFSVFTRATDALRAAHRLQVAVRAEEWPAAAVIRTRAAVHTGEAVERDGDYFGPAVNRVARLRGAAHGGEVVVSAATAAIVSGALPAGWDLVDIGTVELRGLGPQSAFLLAAPDLDPIRRRRPTPDGGVSRREAEVLDLVVESRTNAEIAARAVHLGAHRGVARVVAAPQARRVRPARPRPARPRSPGARNSGAGGAAATGARAAGRSRPVSSAGSPNVTCSAIDGSVAVAGHTLLVVVAAEAGMGKSRLVAELAAEVHADGGRVLFGACYEDVEQPYGPFAQAIADAVDGGPVGVPIEVASVLPGAARRPHQRADDLAAPAAVIDGIRHWLTIAAASAPTLLVIEDLHWSTATTRDVVRQLVRTAGRARLLVVATTRDTAPDLDHDLATLLADLERSPAVTRLELRGLDRDEVAALVGVAADDADADRRRHRRQPAARHPLDGRRTIPDPSSALLARRDALLDDQARGLLDLAATFGAEFDADLLAAGCGVHAAGRARVAGGRRGRRAGRPAAGTAGPVRLRPRPVPLAPLRRPAAAPPPRPARQRGEPRWRARPATGGCRSGPATPASRSPSATRGPRSTLACEAAHEAEHAYAYDEAAAHYERALVAAARSTRPTRARRTISTVRLRCARSTAPATRRACRCCSTPPGGRGDEGDDSGAGTSGDLVVAPRSHQRLRAT